MARKRNRTTADPRLRGFWALVARWLKRLVPERSLDLAGERAAARFLRRRGYRIVAQRDRSALGEIDLVAIDGKTVVFVEVKTREGQEAGHPSEAVDNAKRRRLARLGLAYLKRHHLLGYPARFDVVAVTWPHGRRRPTIEHFQNAFDASGE